MTVAQASRPYYRPCPGERRGHSPPLTVSAALNYFLEHVWSSCRRDAGLAPNQAISQRRRYLPKSELFPWPTHVRYFLRRHPEIGGAGHISETAELRCWRFIRTPQCFLYILTLHMTSRESEMFGITSQSYFCNC